MFKHTLFFLINIALCSGLYAEELKPKPHYSDIAQTVAEHFPYHHLNRTEMNDTISSRAWSNYINTLDYNHVYFTKEDIALLRQDELSLDNQILSGDLNFAYKAFKIFKDRVENRHAYVKTLLELEFNFKQKESYQWNRKDLPWQSSNNEWNNTWRKKIKNEYLQQVIAKEITAKEAKKKKTKPDDKNTLKKEELTPKEFILKRYKQFETVIQDNDAEWVLQKYLSSFAQAYDPHSTYMSPSQVADFNIDMKLSLEGIGAVLSPEDGAAKVVRLIVGGPAESDDRDVQLTPGDKIIGVGQGNEPILDTLHLPLSDVVRRIRGPKGTKVVLNVIPVSDPSGSTTKIVDIIRDEVKLEEQAAKYEIREMKDDNGQAKKMGIITLPAFYANMEVLYPDQEGFRSATHDVRKLITEKETEIDGLLIDLRGNGGGSLWEAIRMTGLFIPTGPTVQVKDRIHAFNQDQYRLSPLYDNDPSVTYDGPMVVLVNRLSASASEILAGALQDYGRAVIVGDSKTHGKGTVQSVLDLNTDDARFGKSKITTASYYRISGSSTQIKGVSPDILVPSVWDYISDIGEDYKANAIPWSLERQAKYTVLDNLAPILPALREQSVKRRAADKKFKAYLDRLDLIEKHSGAKMMSLNIKERRKEAKMEQELADLQIDLLADKDSDTKEQDLVLNEGLQILIDLAKLRPLKNKEVESKKTIAKHISGGSKKKR